MKAEVDKDKYTGCGLCIDECPVEAITIEDGTATISDEWIACGFCTEICPVEAISLEQ